MFLYYCLALAPFRSTVYDLLLHFKNHTSAEMYEKVISQLPFELEKIPKEHPSVKFSMNEAYCIIWLFLSDFKWLPEEVLKNNILKDILVHIPINQNRYFLICDRLVENIDTNELN